MNGDRELTVTALILGVVLAVVFGAANAYLGLRVGLTVSASVPAAVISMGVLRFVLRRDSILENNMVQTIGSAGESLAAGGWRHIHSPRFVFVGRGASCRIFCPRASFRRPDRLVGRDPRRAADGAA